MVVKVRYNLSDPTKGWKVFINGELFYYQKVIFNCPTSTSQDETDSGVKFNISANPTSYDINEDTITFNN